MICTFYYTFSYYLGIIINTKKNPMENFSLNADNRGTARHRGDMFYVKKKPCN